MYLIVDKRTNQILHMSNSRPDEDRRPDELFPSFDPATMTFGRAPEQFVPAEFVIEDGVVKDKVPPSPPPPAETLDQARRRVTRGFTDASLSARRLFLPDYQLANAGLGIYDDARTQLIRDTVQAFRDEVGRLEAAAAKAKSIKELEQIKPAFPTALIDAKAKGKAKSGTGLQ